MENIVKNCPAKQKNYRSTCPVNYALEMFGDKWSLLILRDIVRYKKRTYGEFLSSEEEISTNILADRLDKLEQTEILRKTADKNDKRKSIYKLTQKGIDLFPTMLEIILWGVKYNPETDEYYKAFLPLIEKDKQAYINKRIKELADFANSE